MPPNGNSNNKKELGRLQGQMDGVEKSQTRMEGKIDRILDVLPKHEERLDSLERAKQNWTRFFIGVGIVVVGAVAVSLFLPK